MYVFYIYIKLKMCVCVHTFNNEFTFNNVLMENILSFYIVLQYKNLELSQILHSG